MIEMGVKSEYKRPVSESRDLHEFFAWMACLVAA